MSNREKWVSRVVCWVIILAIAWGFGTIAHIFLEGRWEFAAHIAIAFYSGAAFIRVFDYDRHIRCLRHLD